MVRSEANDSAGAESDVHLLAGLTVLDFSQVLAGPTATRLLAELGADVIKVELSPHGDSSRRLPYLRDGRSGYYIQQNRGKKSVCINAKTAAGVDLLRGLVGQSDVLIENFSPGAIERMGFGYDDVKRIRPDIIMCSISAFGRQGPLSDRPGYDGVAQAYAGVMYMNGDPAGPPSLLQVSPGDSATGVYALSAVLAALLHRERTGRGQYIELSLLHSYFNMHEINVQAVSGSSGQVHPERSGSHHFSVCPYGIFGAADGYLLIAVVTDQQWQQLCRALDRDDLADRPDLMTNDLRSANRESVISEIEQWLRQRTVADAQIVLDDARIPCAPVLSVEDAMAHPHHRDQGVVRTVTDPVWGPVDLPGIPFRFSEFPHELDLEACELGAYSRDVLRTRLGYSDEEIDHMVADGVVAEPPRS